ncbi:MAG: MMPL family transporter [Gammaproteobacteria bacterium]|nr:MMPL family transporter [Gammaproteobacteria bacterium]
MFLDLIFRRRALTLMVCLSFVGLASFGLTFLQVSTDNRIFYGPENPYFQDYLEFESQFTANDNVLFVITGPYRVSEQPHIRAIRWLTDQASGLSHAIRVDSLSNYPYPSSKDGTLRVETFIDWMCPQPDKCRKEVRQALNDTQLTNRLVSPDLKSSGVLATVSIERGAVDEIETLNAQARELAKEFELQHPNFDVYFTGGVPMMAAFAEATADDLGILLPLALVIISILLVLVLGSVPLASMIIVMGIASVSATLGLAGWAGHTLNNATSIVPLVVFTLVVTSSMHIAVHFSREMDGTANNTRTLAQARASLASSLVPMAISAATSAVSLCSLWFVDSPPIRQLGLISALGVVVGFSITVTAMPVLLGGVRAIAKRRVGTLIQGAVNAYARRQEAGKDFIAGPAIALAISGAGLLALDVNDDFVKFFDESVPFRINTDKATELLAGPNHIEVVVSNENGSVFDPDFLAYVDAASRYLRNSRLVANAHSFSDVMNQISKAFAGKPLGDVQSTEELAQLFLVYELSLQIGQTNTDLINASQDSARISVLLKESTSTEIQELERQIYAWHRTNANAFQIKVTGENIPVAHLSWMNIKSMLVGIFVSLSFTAAVVGTTFRGLRLGYVALLATVLPVLAGFGLWGWINQEIGLAATAIIALTIGVVVDDAAHYMYRFLDGSSRLDLEPRSAAAYATHRAGTAITSTSVVMTAGLAVLLLSNFAVNRTFGVVTCLIIVTALVFNLTLLPRLTVWAITNRRTSVESTS